MSLRKRTNFEKDTYEDDSNKGIKGTISKLDIHPKLNYEAKNKVSESKSTSGAFLSIFLILVALFVFWEESTIFFSPVTENFMFVDDIPEEQLNIEFEITFYKLKCNEVTMDAVDFNGEQQINVEHDIRKYGRTKDLNLVDNQVSQTKLGSAEFAIIHPPGYCGSCFGITNPDGSTRCCNTCKELIDAFNSVGRAESLAQSSPQCLKEKKYGVLPEEYGCTIAGSLSVNKMEGNFHVAAGSSHAQGHQDHSHHVHHINKTSIQTYDISHHISHLRFGNEFYPAQEFPLENYDYIAEGLGNLVYYIQLVPTIYETLSGERIVTNQYSVYKHYTPVDTSKSHYRLPGVFFKYQYYPMRIVYVEQSKSLFQFIIRMFSILGGMYGIANLFVQIVFNFTRKQRSSSSIPSLF